MDPIEHAKWIKTATLRELIDSAIWGAVMEYTAWTGWTDKARESLVESVQESVRWALDERKVP